MLLKGNVVDMGVGIIIGVAFGKIVSPLAGGVMGDVYFSNLTAIIKDDCRAKPAVAIN